MKKKYKSGKIKLSYDNQEVKMKIKNFLSIVLVFAVFMSVFSDGYIIPIPRPRPRPVPIRHLTVNYHKVYINVDNQLVTTKVVQEFHNPNNFIFEGDYIFPVPEGAVITKFNIWEKGKKLKGELLDAAEARRIYSDIVRRMRDPGLLEWMNSKAYRVRIFPIGAGKNKKIEMEYTEMLNNENGLLRYRYPLKIENLGKEKIKEVFIECNIKSNEPIRNIYSTTHDISISERGEKSARISFEKNNIIPDKDFILYYSISKKDVGINLITFKEGNEDGFFAALFAPKSQVDKKNIQPKNIVFVFDRSGSMSGKKIVQAKAGLKFCIEHLNEKDNFNIIAFSDYIERLSRTLLKANSGNVKKAIAFIKDFNANGGTDIYTSLEEGLSYLKGETRNYLIFLTDGLPTVGTTNVIKILNNVAKKNRTNTKLFVWGVGYDVNTHFLDKLANKNKGFSEYIEPEEDIEIKISNFYSKIQNPFLAELKFSVSGIDIYDVFPKELPDLFSGSQLVIAGRYKRNGNADIILRGIIGRDKIVYKKKVDFPIENSHSPTIAYIWAARKIGYLTEQVRLNNDQELIDEIIRLSKKYGIVTEYTSFLAREDSIAVSKADSRVRFESIAKPAMDKLSGRHAVKQSKKLKTMKYAQTAQSNVYYNEEGTKVIIDTLSNIAQQSFVKKGNVWNTLDIKKGQKTDLKVQTFSDGYFQLLDKYPDLVKYFSLSNNIIINYKGKILEINEKEGEKKLLKKQLEMFE